MPSKNVKVWKTIHVQEYIDSGDLPGAIQDALNTLSAAGYEPAFVTEVGGHQGVHVVVSGWWVAENE